MILGVLPWLMMSTTAVVSGEASDTQPNKHKNVGYGIKIYDGYVFKISTKIPFFKNHKPSATENTLIKMKDSFVTSINVTSNNAIIKGLLLHSDREILTLKINRPDGHITKLRLDIKAEKKDPLVNNCTLAPIAEIDFDETAAFPSRYDIVEMMENLARIFNYPIGWLKATRKVSNRRSDEANMNKADIRILMMHCTDIDKTTNTSQKLDAIEKAISIAEPGELNDWLKNSKQRITKIQPTDIFYLIRKTSEHKRSDATNLNWRSGSNNDNNQTVVMTPSATTITTELLTSIIFTELPSPSSSLSTATTSPSSTATTLLPTTTAAPTILSTTTTAAISTTRFITSRGKLAASQFSLLSEGVTPNGINGNRMILKDDEVPRFETGTTAAVADGSPFQQPEDERGIFAAFAVPVGLVLAFLTVGFGVLFVLTEKLRKEQEFCLSRGVEKNRLQDIVVLDLNEAVPWVSLY